MKTYTIGRDANCHIQFSDPQISRRHALIKVYPMGRMELVDMSSNGTYVNGIKVVSNKSIPISRKDSVVFAHVGQLDWHNIPNPLKWLYYLGFVAAALLVIILMWLYIPQFVDYATGSDVDIEIGSSMGTSSGNNGSISPTPSPSSPEQAPVAPKEDKKNVKNDSKSWEQKILDDDKKKKEAEKSDSKDQHQKQNQKQNQKQDQKQNQNKDTTKQSKSEKKIDDIIY